VGGVSLFGGMDPMAALKNKGKKANEVKDVTPPPKEVKEPDNESREEPPPMDSPKQNRKAKAGAPYRPPIQTNKASIIYKIMLVEIFVKFEKKKKENR
jgi:hypothetical protein